MSNLFFSADPHFGHGAMAATGKGWRPFATVQEHDETLIWNWNQIVRPVDQVWLLGDCGMGRDTDILNTVRRLNGVKHLIVGNHDAPWPSHRDSNTHIRRWMEVFESVQLRAERKVAHQRVMLSHLPYTGDHTDVDRHQEYRPRDFGHWLIHGHVHDAWKINGRQINVGVDVWDWRPVSIDEIATIIRGDASGQGPADTRPQETQRRDG